MKNISLSKEDREILKDLVKDQDYEELSSQLDQIFSYQNGLSFNYQLKDMDQFIEVQWLIRNIFGTWEDRYVVLDTDMLSFWKPKNVKQLLDKIEGYINKLSYLRKWNSDYKFIS